MKDYLIGKLPRPPWIVAGTTVTKWLKAVDIFLHHLRATLRAVVA